MVICNDGLKLHSGALLRKSKQRAENAAAMKMKEYAMREMILDQCFSTGREFTRNHFDGVFEE